MNKFIYDVIRVRCVTDAVGRAQQHLEQNVRNRLAQLLQPQPGIFEQEPQGHVKRGAAPHFQRIKTRHLMRHIVGCCQHVIGADARRHQRLMGVAEGGIGEQQAFLVKGPLGEFFRAQLGQQLLRAWRWLRRVVNERSRDSRDRWLGFSLHFRIAIDDDFAQVRQDFGGAILAHGELEQRRFFRQKRRSNVAFLELRMVDDVLQERDVRLHATDAKLAQSAVHAVAGVGEFPAPGGHLNQQRIVKRCDDCAAISRGAIESNTESRRRPIRMNLAVIRHEIISRILSGHATLKSATVNGYVCLLRQ